MPRVETEQELIPAGEHILTLRSVDEKEMDDKYGSNGGEPVTRWLWRFVSKERDEDDKPYILPIYTNTRYGNTNASLTHLLDLLIPGITKEQARELDTDDLIGNRYRARIKHTQNGTKTRAELITASPIKARKAAEDEEEERPRKKRPADDEDDFEEAPKAKRKPVTDDDDEAPRPKRKPKNEEDYDPFNDD